jgi:hypothetical protein
MLIMAMEGEPEPKSYFYLADKLIADIINRVVALEKWKAQFESTHASLSQEDDLKIEELQQKMKKVWSWYLGLDYERDDVIRQVEGMAKILWEDRRMELESRKKLLEGLNRS